MKRSALVLVSVVLLSLFSARAEADASANQYALRFFQGVSAGSEPTVKWFLLSTNEARAYYAGVNQQSYNRYVQVAWNEVREWFARMNRMRQKGTSIQVVGVDIARADAVSGGKYVRPTVIVTARPIYMIEGRGRVLGDDYIQLIKVNNYWKLASVSFD
jgi:hypothetical protein